MKPHHSIRSLTTAFVLLTMALGVVGWQGVGDLRQLHSQMQSVVFGWWAKEQLSQEGFRLSDENSQIILFVFLLDDPDEINRLLDQRVANTKRIGELQSAIDLRLDTDKEKELFTAVKATRKPYVESYQQALALLLTEHKPEEARRMMREVVRPKLATYHAAWAAFDQHEMDETKEVATQSKLDYAAGLNNFLITLVLTGALTGLVAVFTVGQIAREMAVRLRAEQSLSLAKDHLEERVAQRTSELQASEARLNMALDSGKMGAWELDLAKDASVRTLKHDQIFGYPALQAEWGRERFMGHILPEDREAVLKQFETALATDHLQFECRIQWPDQSIHWIAVQGQVYRDRGGAPVRMLGVVAEITERKRAETAASQLAAIVEYSAEAIIGKDLDGIVTSWNKGAERLFGYRADEVIGTSITHLFPPERRDEEEKILATIKSGEILRDFETQRMTKDGRRIDVAVTVSPIRDSAGRVVSVSKLARDITERKRAEEKVRGLNEELTQRAAQLEVANKELESFSYSVSHDLRAPLRHIQGYVELLRRQLQDRLSDKATRYLGVITDAGRQMGELIDGLLSFSRMGRSEMHENVVELGGVVQECVKLLEMAVKGRAIVWKIAPLPSALGDVTMLRQVLANLLGNAVKYTGPRDPAVIEVGCAGEEAGRVIFFVRDNGVGFDPQYGHKLFGVFQRLHRADEFEGTGIGLANVRRIIGRHGGRAWAEGKLGEGATIYFTLKRARQR